MSDRATVLCSCCGFDHSAGHVRSRAEWEKNLEALEEYEYDWLPSQKQWTRILILRQDLANSPTIVCELIPKDLGDDVTDRKKHNIGSRLEGKKSTQKGQIQAEPDEEASEEWHSGTESEAEYKKQKAIRAKKKLEKKEKREAPASVSTQNNGNRDNKSPTHVVVEGEEPAAKSQTDDTTNLTDNAHDVFSAGAPKSSIDLDNHHLPPTVIPDSSDIKFEALSWCWGTSSAHTWICISEDERLYKKKITRELYAALLALRWKEKVRYLWVDAICIDQEDLDERNHQVEMMTQIYGKANRVCIWLGEGDQSSKMALNFIRNEILKLQNFDELCESQENTRKWNALLDLMQRPWFSRRWVVQEIALAKKAAVYCGHEKISWKKFAIAVELFVEVETATHRLSEVMQKDENFYHIPGWFEYVSMLGASLLVEATGKLFRDWKPNGAKESTSEVESDSNDLVLDLPQPSRPFHRGDPLLTLEYLVSSLAIFQVTNPHDAIYALLAIARDTRPVAVQQRRMPIDAEHLTPISENRAKEKDVGSNFPTGANSASQGLLISNAYGKAPDAANTSNTLQYDSTSSRKTPLFIVKDVEQTKDPAIEHDPDHEAKKKVIRAFSAFTKQKDYKVDYIQPYSEACKEFVYFCIHNADPTRAFDILCRPWAPDPPEKKLEVDSGAAQNSDAAKPKPKPHTLRRKKKKNRSDPSHPANRVEEKDVPLPSWIARLDGASHEMYYQPGSHTQRMGRKNADPLVGLPASMQGLQRNYAAAGTRKIYLNSTRFRRRERLGHYSMYLQGFVLDKIKVIGPASQSGSIPRHWVGKNLGDWKDCPRSDPPDEFWRTLVADRGRDGKNPPVYYSRACKESFNKGGLSSGSVNSTDLINNERNSVVAQFCRRVQAVIWNRRLMRTESGLLGLAPQHAEKGDLICILYGCSVPVVLHHNRKDLIDVDKEAKEDGEYILKELTNRLGERWTKHANWANDNQDRYRVDKEARKARERRPGKTDDTWDEDRKEWISAAHQKNLDKWNSDLEILQIPKREKREEGRKAKEMKNSDVPNVGAASRSLTEKGGDFQTLVSKEIQDQSEHSITGSPTSSPRQIYKTSEAFSSSVDSKVARAESSTRNDTYPSIESYISTPSGSLMSPFEGGTARTDTMFSRGESDLTSPSLSPPTRQTSFTPDTHESLLKQGLADPDLGGYPPNPDAVEHGGVADHKPKDSIEQQPRTPPTRDLASGIVEQQPPKKKHYRTRLEEWLKEPQRQGRPKKKELPDSTDSEAEDGEESGDAIPMIWEDVAEHPCFYQFMGECYLHGMMDGEAIAYQNKKKIPTQTFELR